MSNQKNLFKEILQKYSNRSLEILLSNSFIRKGIIKFVDKKIYSILLKDKNYPQQVQLDKYYLIRALILAINKALKQAKRSPMVYKALINSFIYNIFFKSKPQEEEFRKKFNQNPPDFLTISPTRFCNLKCFGCYANSSSAFLEKLDWDILNRIITEARNLWGVYFIVISGGEPLLYESQGKTIIDLAKNHPDNYFLMYTNGTLIDKEMAKKLAEVGNITPAISVEGFKKETEARRGKGVYEKIIKAMSNLQKVGVPFGISITATRNNASLVVSDKLIDFYFKKCGAIYAWIFQLMPIGRADSLDLMVTPEQRLKMFRKTQHLVKDHKIFIADFWNSGCVSNGCISAGRTGGYLYIEWNGNVTPCVFNPYSPVNIYDVYKKGGTLNDVLKEPFFEAIRQWQKDYALNKGNWLIPCAIRDHYKMMKKLLNKYHPKPIDEAAQKALNDLKYQQGLEEYNKKMAEIADPVWEKEYLKIKKIKN